MTSDRDADLAILRNHAVAIAEHFDTVMIFATRHEPGPDGGSVGVHHGRGSWFARFGQVREWLIKEEAVEGRKAIREDEEERWRDDSED